MAIKLFTIILLFTIYSTVTVVDSSRLNLTLTGLFLSHPLYTTGVQYFLPAVELAVKEITHKYDFNITLLAIHSTNISTCTDLATYNYLISEFYYKSWDRHGQLVILGPGCEEMELLAQLAREWNSLMLISSAVSPEMHTRSNYPTMRSFTPLDYDQLVQVFFSFFRLNSWKNIAIVYNSNTAKYPAYMITVNAFQIANTRAGTNFSITYLAFSSSDQTDYVTLMRRIRIQHRIVVVLLQQDTVRDFMLEAHYQGMTTDEYVYFTLVIFPNPRRFGQLAWYLGDKNDAVARYAYRNLYQVCGACFNSQDQSLRSIGGYIRSEGIERFSAIYNNDELVNPLAFASYFSVTVLGQVLDEMIKNGTYRDDGHWIAEKFNGRTFPVEGVQIHINRDGFLAVDACVKAFDSQNGLLQPIIRVGSADAAPAERFAPMGNWSGWRNFPPDEPRCGFMGDNPTCRDGDKEQFIIIGVVVAVLLIIVVAFTL